MARISVGLGFLFHRSSVSQSADPTHRADRAPHITHISISQCTCYKHMPPEHVTSTCYKHMPQAHATICFARARVSMSHSSSNIPEAGRVCHPPLLAAPPPRSGRRERLAAFLRRLLFFGVNRLQLRCLPSPHRPHRPSPLQRREIATDINMYLLLR